MPCRLRSFAHHAACMALLSGVWSAALATPESPKPGAPDKSDAPASAGANAPLVLLPDLRSRIEERLAKVRAARAEGATPVLHLATKSPETGPDRASTSKAAAAGPTAAPSAVPRPVAVPRPAPKPPVHWSYDGEGGPQAWGRLEPEFSTCRTGQRQSPIDIQGGIAVELEAIRFEYQPGAFRVLDTGHTVQVIVAPGNFLTVGGRRYELQQFHFHRPSEERINGRQFAMSAHLVHRSDDGRLAVVAVLMDEGRGHPAVQLVWNNLPLEKHEEQLAPVALDPAALLPEDRRYITYMGSLTTPPCSEGVLWMVMKEPASLSPEQAAIFAKLYPMNARPVQSASGRLIKESN
jgi:carbonic anhydrase